jgi:hypothetical protein
MMSWDWTFVGELAVGVGVGLGAGGWFVVDRLEVAAMRIVSNPSVRKLANAADRFSGADSGGWSGVVGKVVDGLMGAFGGGGHGGGKKALVVNEAGELVGEVMVDASGRPLRR